MKSQAFNRIIICLIIAFSIISCKKEMGVSRDTVKQLIGEWTVLYTSIGSDGVIIEYSNATVEFTKNGKHKGKQGDIPTSTINYKIVKRASDFSTEETEQLRLKSNDGYFFSTIEFRGADTLVMHLEDRVETHTTFYVRKE